MSNTVTATGMKVKAVTEGSLLIAYGATEPEDSAFLITASANMSDAAALKPASTVNLTNWASTSAASRTAKTAQSATARNDISANTEGYVLKPNTFWLYSENPTYVYLSGLSIKKDGVAVPLGWNGNNSAYFWNCIRVGVKCGDEWYIYAPSIQSAAGNNVATPDTSFVGDKLDGSWSVATLTKAEEIKVATNGGTASNHCGIVASNVKTEMQVYIWFEGEDGACYTNNIVLDGVEIAIELKSTSLTQSQQTGAIDSTTPVNVDGVNYYQVGTTGYYVTSASAAVGADIYTISSGHAVKSALYVYGGE